MELLNKLLVANRGEIALRIIRSAKLLGIPTVAIYPESEKESGYVQLADEKVSLGEDDLNATYLNINRIIDIAVATGSAAIHPGYGFLSENPDFAQACKENRIIFVGPEPAVLRLMGNKPDAKVLARSLGIPVISGHMVEILQDPAGLEITYPAMVKASFGGGGKGIKIVSNPGELSDQLKRSSRTALEYFGNGELFVEQYIPNARHVEVQIIGDSFGNIVHLYERECSVQRNHQKIVEEAPAVFLSTELRGELLSAAVKIGKATGYTGAGTVEFLVDQAGNYFFMEMNPRIQVEHAVTEEITGIDIVSEQLKIAAGCPVSFRQEQVVITGHAIEARLYAEDPAREFRPSSQPVLSVHLPLNKNTRIEADMNVCRDTMNNFDPLLLKLIARGENRIEAINVLFDSIKDLNIIGPETNAAYLEMILTHPRYRQNDLSVEFCRNHHRELTVYRQREADPNLLPFLAGLAIVNSYLEKEASSDIDPWQYIGYWRNTIPVIPVTANDITYRVSLTSLDRSMPAFLLNGAAYKIETIVRYGDGIEMTINGVTRKMNYHLSDTGETMLSARNMQHRITLPNLLEQYPESGIRQGHGAESESSEVLSPLHGKILDIYIKENQLIKKGDPLLVIEAMKTENHILSHKDARVKKISVKVGAQVTDRMPLVILEE